MYRRTKQEPPKMEARGPRGGKSRGGEESGVATALPLEEKEAMEGLKEIIEKQESKKRNART